ncbi:MAG: hypothetical protein ABGW97_14985 [Christiangramia sp.]|uniref:hypothetical protein n=1 Tax=Christiangramia sp. TaxID=1931228 RepID=UPI003242CDD2
MMKKLIYFFLVFASFQVIAQEQPESPYKLDQSFHFDKKIDFELKMDGKIVRSYIYFNTSSGYSLLEKDFFSQYEGGQNLDYQITFPQHEEQFLYTVEQEDHKRRSFRIHKPVLFAGQDLSNMAYFMAYFRNMQPTGQTVNMGEKGDFYSEEYEHSNAETAGDMKFYISKYTDAFLKDNSFCVSWLGLGYLNVSNRTFLITKISSASHQFQINLVTEKNADYTFNGQDYESVSVFLNEQIESMANSQAEAQNVFVESLQKIEDPEEKNLRKEAQKLKDADQQNMMDIMKQMAKGDGKIEDVYAAANSFMDPVQKIEIQKADLKVEKQQISEKLKKESAKEYPSEKKMTVYKLQLDKVNEKSNVLDIYKRQFDKLKTDHAEKPMKLINKNVEVFMEMNTKLQEVETKFEKEIKNVK